MKCLKNGREQFLLNSTFFVRRLCVVFVLLLRSIVLIFALYVSCCPLSELYSQSALHMSKPPSELWDKCLFLRREGGGATGSEGNESSTVAPPHLKVNHNLFYYFPVQLKKNPT